MTMLELNKWQRSVLIDKVPDVANVAVGATVFGQLLSGRAFSWSVAVWGLVVWLLCFGVAIWLARRELR
jgi:type IV secretory pathway TrbD component